jgi:hypothetical protein
MRLGALIILLTVVLIRADNQQPDATQKLQAELMTQEIRLLEAFQHQDSKALQTLLAVDFLAIRANPPVRLAKSDFLQGLSSFRLTGYSADNPRVLVADPNVSILTYQLSAPEMGRAWVSTTWAQRGGKWVVLLWQETSIAGAAPGVLTTIEAILTPTGLRYRYDGSGTLEDIWATTSVTLTGGGRVAFHEYWGTWRPGEVKEVSLAALAFGTAAVQRVDFTGTATRQGKEVRLSVTSRR